MASLASTLCDLERPTNENVTMLQCVQYSEAEEQVCPDEAWLQVRTAFAPPDTHRWFWSQCDHNTDQASLAYKRKCDMSERGR